MKKGDSFLVKGSSIEEPMTLYHIVDMKEDKLLALCVCISNNMVQSLDIPNEYDKDIPSDAVMLSPESYDDLKQSMKDFLLETADFLKERIITNEMPIKTGYHYYDGYIKTVTRIVDDRIYYNLFRLEPENISPYWTGDCCIEDFERRHVGIISEETYIEVRRRYEVFIAALRGRLYKCPGDLLSE